MAEASQGVTRDRLVWTAEAYIGEETYKGAPARIIDAHDALPIAAIWGDGTVSPPHDSLRPSTEGHRRSWTGDRKGT